MGKRKKRKGKKEEKPYCWYCDRHFQEEKILIQHQKAKHFKCHICHKKLTSASGMVVHVFQVHKETVSKIPNAKPGRDSVRNDVIGMTGIPGEEDEEPESKKQKTDPMMMGQMGSFPTFPAPYGMPFGMPYGIPPTGMPSTMPSGMLTTAIPPRGISSTGIPPRGPWFPPAAAIGNPGFPTNSQEHEKNNQLNNGQNPSPGQNRESSQPINQNQAFNHPTNQPLSPNNSNQSRGGLPQLFQSRPFPVGNQPPFINPVQMPHPMSPTAGRGEINGPRGFGPPIPTQLFPIQQAQMGIDLEQFPTQQLENPNSPIASGRNADGSKPQSKVVLVYDDAEVSTEEKRAALDRYCFSAEKSYKISTNFNDQTRAPDPQE